MTKKLRTDFGDYEVTVTATRYQNNDNYAVTLTETDGMPFATLTVNLGVKLKRPYAYIDTNNCPWAEKFIKDNNLGEFTGLTGQSGYCTYPLYRLNDNIIPEV